MLFHRTIYFADKPLVLTADAAWYRSSHPKSKGFQTFTGAFARNFRLATEHLEQPTSLGAIIQDISPEALERELTHFFTPVDASGGLLRDEHNRVLMIHRRGLWDLPKGKCDAGEQMQACALREVEEETGVKAKVDAHLCDTFHVYPMDGKLMLKRTSWYAMTADSKEELTPQAEEDISEVLWIAPGEIGPYAFRSFETIRQVLKAGGLQW
jgi:8-oxo-dGTP pyrophosphatase MutT (NUDIX family)